MKNLMTTNLKTTALIIAVSAALTGCNSGGGDSASSKGTQADTQADAPDNRSRSHVIGEMEYIESVTHIDRYYDVKATFTNVSEEIITNPVVTANDSIAIVSTTCDSYLAMGESCEVTGKFRPEQEGLDYDLTYYFDSDQAYTTADTTTTSAEPVLWFTTTPISSVSGYIQAPQSIIRYYNNSDHEMTRTFEKFASTYESNTGISERNCNTIAPRSTCEETISFNTPKNTYGSNPHVNFRITDQDGNQSYLYFESGESKHGISYGGADWGTTNDVYDPNRMTEAYYEVGKTYRGVFQAKMWDLDDDSDTINLGMVIETSNGLATVLGDEGSNRCEQYAGVGEELSEREVYCDYHYEYTPSQVGPVEFKFITSWTDTKSADNGIAEEKQSVWIETKNVVEVVDIEVVIDGTTNEVEAFNTDDIFKGQPHDERFNIVEDTTQRNGFAFRMEMDSKDFRNNYKWDTTDEKDGNRFHTAGGNFNGALYSRIDGDLYNFADADPRSLRTESRREFVLVGDNLTSMSSKQGEDSAALLVSPWRDGLITHKINFKVITDVQ